MHHGYWNDDWSWLGMGLMMLIVWGSLITLGVILVRRTGHTAPPASSATVVRPGPTATAQQILAERLARGEIEPDDYRARKAVLDSTE